MKKKLIIVTTIVLLATAGFGYQNFNSSARTCPLEGTAQCPKLSCPLAGTPDCPYNLKASELPACCKYKSPENQTN